MQGGCQRSGSPGEDIQAVLENSHVPVLCRGRARQPGDQSRHSRAELPILPGSSAPSSGSEASWWTRGRVVCMASIQPVAQLSSTRTFNKKSNLLSGILQSCKRESWNLRLQCYFTSCLNSLLGIGTGTSLWRWPGKNRVCKGQPSMGRPVEWRGIFEPGGSGWGALLTGSGSRWLSQPVGRQPAQWREPARKRPPRIGSDRCRSGDPLRLGCTRLHSETF